ncbi:PP2C family protein-serine/threonine phosphatase [Streptomyces sp. NPDC020799]|uniref:PP2C family protein-serine/threonine phosphatase n=1 Tax=unclassified Streptomyces TaxID=2593676 RepID=UPI0033BFF3B8
MHIKRVPDGGRVLTALLITGIAALAVLDCLTGTRLRLALVASVMPLIAARLCSLGRTVVVAAVFAVAQAVTHCVIMPRWDTAGVLVAVLGALLVAGFSVALCAALLEREAAYDRTRMVADAVQRTILRELPLTAGPLRIAGFYISAQEGARVGGDIYEVVESPAGQQRILIGDVQGKGMPAIGAGHAVLTSFREAAYHEATLEAVADHMEGALLRHNSALSLTGTDERFVTALLLEVGPPGTTTRVLSCGHIPYYVISGDRVEERLPEHFGLPLGLGPLTGAPRRAVDSASSSEWLVLCTDGVTEARDPQGRFYPLRERLSHWAQLPPPDLARALRADLETFTEGELKDDAAVLIVRDASACGGP